MACARAAGVDDQLAYPCRAITSRAAALAECGCCHCCRSAVVSAGGDAVPAYCRGGWFSAIAAAIGRSRLASLGLAAAAGDRAARVSDECLARCAAVPHALGSVARPPSVRAAAAGCARARCWLRTWPWFACAPRRVSRCDAAWHGMELAASDTGRVSVSMGAYTPGRHVGRRLGSL